MYLGYCNIQNLHRVETMLAELRYSSSSSFSLHPAAKLPVFLCSCTYLMLIAFSARRHDHRVRSMSDQPLIQALKPSLESCYVSCSELLRIYDITRSSGSLPYSL